MWFERKRQPMPEEDLNHWPGERMIAEGYSEYAVPEDLEGLSDEVLVNIAEVCQVNEFAPDECIPCLAHVTLMERREAEKAQLEAMSPTLDAVDGYLPGLGGAMDMPLDPDGLLRGDATFPAETEEIPVVERFARQVRSLSDLVGELLEGPPIPPPDVSTNELAALVVGAERWVNIMDAQGIELAPQQQAVKNEIARVIAKVKR